MIPAVLAIIAVPAIPVQAHSEISVTGHKQISVQRHTVIQVQGHTVIQVQGHIMMDPMIADCEGTSSLASNKKVLFYLGSHYILI